MQISSRLVSEYTWHDGMGQRSLKLASYVSLPLDFARNTCHIYVGTCCPHLDSNTYHLRQHSVKTSRSACLGSLPPRDAACLFGEGTGDRISWPSRERDCSAAPNERRRASDDGGDLDRGNDRFPAEDGGGERRGEDRGSSYRSFCGEKFALPEGSGVDERLPEGLEGKRMGGGGARGRWLALGDEGSMSSS